MAVTASCVVPATALTTSVVALYTVPALNTLQIRKVTISNPTAAAHAVSVYLLNPGQTASDSTVLAKLKTVTAGSTTELFVAEGHVLPPAGVISAVTDVVGMVIQVSGVLLT